MSDGFKATGSPHGGDRQPNDSGHPRIGHGGSGRVVRAIIAGLVVVICQRTAAPLKRPESARAFLTGCAANGRPDLPPSLNRVRYNCSRRSAVNRLDRTVATVGAIQDSAVRL